MRPRRLNRRWSKIIEDDDYELEELTESLDEEAPLRRRAESVAVVSWRLVCSCMILVQC